jgi:hypothetical protein
MLKLLNYAKNNIKQNKDPKLSTQWTTCEPFLLANSNDDFTCKSKTAVNKVEKVKPPLKKEEF